MYIKSLKAGGVIGFPTDTVWGLSVDAFNSKAVKLLVNVKKRQSCKSFTVLVSSFAELQKHVLLSDFESNLLKKIWPGSFSVVLKVKDKRWALKLGSTDGTVAFRFIDHKFTYQLLSSWGGLLVSTSANFTGFPVCTSFKEVQKLNSKIQICSNFLNFKEGLSQPSTVIRVLEGKIKILRKAYQYDLFLEIIEKKSWVVEG